MAVDIDVVSNSVSRNDENDSVKESDMPRESISHSQPPKKKRSYTEPRENNKKIEMLAEALDILKTTTTQAQPASNVSLDNENLHFINFIGSKMMRYPPNVRNAVERAITGVLFKADEGYYNFYPKQYAQQLQQWPSNNTTCTTSQTPAPPVRVEVPAISPYGTFSEPSPAYSQLSQESFDIQDLV
ncbi:unnamed protein product [Acanthoscelides obtectus]|uniref:Uncharacterized protein n=1 Tax=Acanthoscelides obtectus TaxID=200917 RepID=A0A9P0KJA8_ACAOB|nr:unnamed protein product [Acanthoscelides obtectus]CAK1664221.1 hypothetical protein AOBTE_LOCUS24135 [Acanthoscelides obtectus]